MKYRLFALILMTFIGEPMLFAQSWEIHDADKDGVIDALDREEQTPPETPVDLNGVETAFDTTNYYPEKWIYLFGDSTRPAINLEEVQRYADQRLYYDQLWQRKKFNPASNICFYTFYFDEFSYKLREDAIPSIEYLYELMARYNKLHLELRGHYDYNEWENGIKLACMRARSVADYLIRKGISPARISICNRAEEDFMITDPKNPTQHLVNRSMNIYFRNSFSG